MRRMSCQTDLVLHHHSELHEQTLQTLYCHDRGRRKKMKRWLALTLRAKQRLKQEEPYWISDIAMDLKYNEEMKRMMQRNRKKKEENMKDMQRMNKKEMLRRGKWQVSQQQQEEQRMAETRMTKKNLKAPMEIVIEFVIFFDLTANFE